ELHSAGKSIRRIALILNEEGRPTKRGVQWHPSTVSRALARAID
ncbi:recombinase family protein, partial [Streptosporangium sp. NPDC049644]